MNTTKKGETMETEKACGAIIIKDSKVLLIQQTDGNWGFPKGHVENEETEVETAIREVKEETNIDVEIDKKHKYIINYKLPNGNMKEVVFFMAKPINSDIKPQEEEITSIEWVKIQDAENKLSFENTRELLRKVIKELEK